VIADIQKVAEVAHQAHPHPHLLLHPRLHHEADDEAELFLMYLQKHCQQLSQQKYMILLTM
jgi:hypothetical protein